MACAQAIGFSHGLGSGGGGGHGEGFGQSFRIPPLPMCPAATARASEFVPSSALSSSAWCPPPPAAAGATAHSPAERSGTRPLSRLTTKAVRPARVDWTRYMGTWYEVAALPIPEEAGCVRSKAEYVLLSAPNAPDAAVSVRNTCILADGRQAEVVGVAQPVGPGSLRVHFDPTPEGPGPAGGPPAGNYWVLEAGAGYEYALVASPDGAWVLSRSPNMRHDVVCHLVARLADVYGFDVRNIKITSWGAPATGPVDAFGTLVPR